MGSPSHCGRFIHSVLGSVISCSYPICSVGTAGSSVMTLGFSASFADDCRDFRRLRHHCVTRVCSTTMSDRCVTHFFRQWQNRKLFGQGACESVDKSVRVTRGIVVYMRAERHNQGMLRVKCAHVGKRSTETTLKELPDGTVDTNCPWSLSSRGREFRVVKGA